VRSRTDTYRQSPPPLRGDEYQYPDEREAAGYWSQDTQRGLARGRMRETSPGRSKAVLITLLAIVVAAGLAAVAYHSLSHGHAAPSATTTHRPTVPPPSAKVAVLKPVSAQAFEDNPADANLAIANNPAQAWQTYQYIGSPFFGGLQQGSGLILNMGRPVRLSSVQVTFESTPGADVQIKIGNPSNPSPSQKDPALAESIANSMTTVAQRSDVSGTVTFPVSSKATGQYILIWFTKLAPMAGTPGKFQGDISDVVVKGSS
jgi:hypothetical protein